MRTLVTYFSRTGQTSRLAREIAKRCDADLDPICSVEPVDSRWGQVRCAWHDLTRAAPPIQKPRRNPANYDLVIIGAPVFRFGVAPPVRSYVRQFADRFKQVAFFCGEGGAGDTRVFAELSALCGKRPVATFAVVRKHLPAVAHIKELTDFVDSVRSL